MGWRTILVAGLGGAVSGAAAVAVWALAGWPGIDLAGSVGRAMPREALANAALGRAPHGFVADSRNPSDLNGYPALVFYGRPRRADDMLCGIEMLSVGHGRLRGSGAFKEAATSEGFVIRRLPDEPEEGLEQAEAACARWRDFSHLVAGDGLVLERVVVSLAAARAQARKGRPGFEVSCVDRREGAPKACDGGAVLAALDIRRTARVAGLDQYDGDGNQTAIDEVVLEGAPGPCGPHEHILLRITSSLPARAEPRDRSIAAVGVELGVAC